MFENAFRNIYNVLRQDSNCSTRIDYIEQTSWVLFLIPRKLRKKAEVAKVNGSRYRQTKNRV